MKYERKKHRCGVVSWLCAAVVLLGMAGCQEQLAKYQQTLSFHFDRPARIWEESFPLGNGRLGLMPDGGVDTERIVLNEISLWSGSPQEADNPQAYYSLGTIRKLLFEDRNKEAQELMYRTFVCNGAGSGQGDGANVPYGSYQLLGNLELAYQYANPEDSVTRYRRELNLQTAVATQHFRRGGVNYTREAFTSFAGDIGVIRLTSDTDRSLNFSYTMNRPEHAALAQDSTLLWLKGQLPDGKDTTACRGMKFAAGTRVLLPKGGTMVAESGRITVSDATEAVLLVSMATDYWRKDYEQQIDSLLDLAAEKGYKTLLAEHTQAYQQLFNRVSLDLGSSERDAWPLDRRLTAFAEDRNDPSLAALYFQFGRYLLISSTRVGLLPPNLQGLWCNTIHTPWNGDYHLNINLQMNLWPAEVANLSELHLPMIEWTKQQVPAGKKTAKAFYNANGWVMHILGNVWEFTAPGEHPSWGATNTSAAWLCEHLYHHYIYTQDTAYLRDVYPTMREAARFFVDMLVKDPRTNYLVTAPTTSPENAYRTPSGDTVSICAGSTMDNQIIRELFTNTIEAAQILGEDSAFAQTLEQKRRQLMPTTIGEDGRIMEWLQPYAEVEPHHRHVSHLYGLYPGNEISLSRTPELAEAARKTLVARGDESTGWSMAWKVNFWARLHDGDHAYKLLGDLLKPAIGKGTDYQGVGGGSFPNLFCSHPPFQIDGNFGGCAGIAEMLIQSHDGYIEVLPAIPSAWADGSFTGLRVRGGGEVSARWSEGKPAQITLRATHGNTFRIKLPDDSANLSLWLNDKPVSLPVIDGCVEIEMREGETFRMEF